MLSKTMLTRARQVLGVINIVLGAWGFYEAYQITLYILNLAPGSLETYSRHVSTLLYIIFVLAISFVIYDRLEAHVKKSRKK